MGVRTVRTIAEAGYPPAATVVAEPEETTPPGSDAGIVSLELADLIQDDNGEIVLFNDSHLPAVALHTDVSPLSEGSMTIHTTAAGEDVSGYRYVAFSNGLTLFYQTDLDLFIVSDNGG